MLVRETRACWYVRQGRADGGGVRVMHVCRVDACRGDSGAGIHVASTLVDYGSPACMCMFGV